MSKPQALPKSLARLVKLLKKATAEDGGLSPKKAKEIVLEADVQEKDMAYYADFGHPVEDCYGRKMVHDAGHFEVMVMSWMPGDYSSIHNHGYTEWGVVQVFGDTHHFIYNLKDNNLSFAKRELLSSGTAIKVNNALIHQMGNTTSKPYLTLHIYGSNELSGEITADSKNFDLEQNRIAYTGGGAFFNLPDNVIEKTETGPKPTREVFLHHAYLLMSYYNRQKPSNQISEMKRSLLKEIEETVLELQGA